MFSQNIPLTGNNILEFLETNFTNWTSGNEKINDFIQERQLKINDHDDNIVLEWIPYNQFNEVKETGKNGLVTIYSAIWEDGPLCKKSKWDKNYTRDSNKEVALKCLHNSQVSIDFLINEAKRYLIINKDVFQVLYGITQNPDTGDYILVLIWASGNEKIDNFIQEKQLKTNDYNDIVLEWIPYNQFNEIKETSKNGLITVYFAIWKDGPLRYNEQYENYTRDSNIVVALKCLNNSQGSIDLLIDEAKGYLTDKDAFQVLYGITQNPDTGDYILIQNNSINLANQISGNEKIDNFIQKRQLKINEYDEAVVEWIPYNQFSKIKETGKNELITVYSAVWKDGPLFYNEQYENYTRESNKEVALKCLNNSQESIDTLINEAKRYSTDKDAFQVLYGISQSPDTRDYILVQRNLTNWISENEKIDNFIQKRQFNINEYDDIVLEWIPYNQFNEVKETGKNDLISVYSAIWKDGLLCKKSILDKNYTREPNKEVALKCLHNSQKSIDFLINEAKKCQTKYEGFQVLYGISQNPDTGDYILVQNDSINLTNWISGNGKIDDFIQERQLKIINYDDIVLEWIPYNQFNEVEETGKNDLIIVYSAIWKDGPLHKKYEWSNYTRDPNKEVALKCLHSSQESIDFLINEAKRYLTDNDAFQVLYGISQNSDTGDYILIQNKSINLTNWISKNEKIDNFIQERQLKINDHNDIVLEWIPYSQFNEISETGKINLITVYSAVWKDGPLYWNKRKKKYTRNSNKKVALKCLHDSKESIDFLINEAKKYPTKYNKFQVLYGISQNPDTGDYIFVLIWASGNKIIDNFIQESQLKINDYNDIVLEWIPYNQFNEIKETGKNGLTTVYSAIWKDGPLHYSEQYENYTRDSNKEVALKCLHNSQKSIDYLINEAKKYLTKYKAFHILYGISQNSDTGDYILVQNNSINLVNWNSGNEKIDSFIQKKQLEINEYKDIVLEWISYNQFSEIKETSKNGFKTVYSAIWKDGPLNCQYSEYKRNPNKEIALICLQNSQKSIDSLINEAKKYPINYEAFQVLYGISQNPDTKDYILVQNSSIILANQISGNEKIDDFIQERQLKIIHHDDIVLEWIPYNQFDEIEKSGKNGLITVYSAIWKDGPLHKKHWWDENYIRDSNKKVALKCLHNLRKSINTLINEAKIYLTNKDEFQVLYGISQYPDTGDYIFVQNNSTNLVNQISKNDKINDFIQERKLKINDYDDIQLEWIPFNQFNEINETSKNELITIYSAIWKDGPLCHNEQYEDSRDPNKEIALKCLNNSQESIDSLINEAKKYSTDKDAYHVLYGISQNPDTGDYILVQNNSVNLTNQISKNEKIYSFIQERQLKINYHDDVVLEWIPYNQFNEVKETGKNDLITVYSAIWKDGPLYYQYGNYKRNSNKEVSLKCLHNSQESIECLINEAKNYPTKYKAFQLLYGMSQHPDSGDYILVLIWTSGNEEIDNYIQERQLNINKYDDIVLEWIPYNQFNIVREIGKNDLIAIWNDGPLYKKSIWDKIHARDSDKEVALKCLYNIKNSVVSLINEARKYPSKYKAFQVLYGISQNPDTGDYILVQNNSTNLANQISKNETIDNFIQEVQLKTNDYEDKVLEWIPYNQFIEIKEIGRNGLITVYSSIWKDGPLFYNELCKNYTRNLNKKVALKHLNNSQKSINSLINEATRYLTDKDVFQVLYGISQNPDTEDFILVLSNYIWISKNEKIDDFIQEWQLKIDDYDGIVVLEWIPYNQFNEVKETGKNELITVYSAIWKDGPLHYQYGEYTRNSNKEVTLKCLHNSQESIECLINEAKKYPIKYEAFQVLYGISQNSDTGDYILVQNNSINLANQISKNVKIYDFILERQLKINDDYDIVLEWIPYNQFNEIIETGKNEFITICSAIWKDGPLHYHYGEYKRNLNKKVTLKCLHNSQESINTLIKKAERYLADKNAFQVLYGISQNPDTGDYILVQNDNTNLLSCQISRNEKIDDFIQERQLKINDHDDIVLEWIPYSQFNEIIETSKNELITVYSAIWKDGPLHNQYGEYTRNSNKKVNLKCLHYSQESIYSLITEAKKYPTKHNAFQALYGISQNPDTGDYFLVLIWTSGNEKIDNFIQEMQSKINDHDDIVFEWIPYNQFNEIKKTGQNGLITVYSAIWMDGPLCKMSIWDKNYARDFNKEVALKCLHNSQKSIDSLINETKKYSTKLKAFHILFGISQNPDTRDYILVQNNSINLANWISGNEKIENFIQERQLKISEHDDRVFEWIPYNQFNEIKETDKNGLITVYSAIWKDGPFYKKYSLEDYTRNSNKEVVLKCLHNSQKSIDSLINEVKKYPTKHKAFQVLYGITQKLDTGEYILVQNNSINLVKEYSINKRSNVLNIYGISQNPDTKEYIMVLQYARDATGRQPFDNRAHDCSLALDICKGIRPEINEPEAPRCYIDLMKKCWDLNLNNRPNILEINELVLTFYKSCGGNFFIVKNKEIEMQFKKAEEYRRANLSSIENYQIVTHPQAIYTSRLLNPFTENLPKYDNDDDNSQCLDHAI
ncbi:uncharacterized protein OCT59_008317 [Rhizophagus irregularis]|uniref:uncharacterized protein n=1 Tax=Rhizophagus irregularis TaxID=588596 RepID=UPI00331AF265|nr:hypothetical protein OCT59_008317 [Rhizophagus irregularis]